MNIGYLILAHKNPMQVARLVDRLYYDGSVIYIHIDRKSEISAFTKILKNKQGVFFVNNRISANWGAFSLVEATLNGLKEMISKHKYIDYVTLLSGQDYPIKKKDIIIEYFRKNIGKEFLHFDPFPTKELPKGGMDRIEYYYDYDNNIMEKNRYEVEMQLLGIKRQFIQNMKPYHGSQWWSLSRKCIEYVLDYIEQNREITNFYRYTRFSDEQVFQTVIMNSSYAKKVINNNLRFIDWSTVNKSTLDWIHNPPHPNVLTIYDYKRLLKSKHLFARKFDESIDNTVLNKIDSEILG